MGLLLALVTVGVVVVHDSGAHRATHTMSVVHLPSAVALVDFRLVPAPGAEPQDHQVVIVRGERIEEVGPVGAVQVPQGALVVRGDGEDFLVPGRESDDTSIRLGAVAPGAPANLLSLEADPRVRPRSRPVATMVRGRWYGS